MNAACVPLPPSAGPAAPARPNKLIFDYTQMMLAGLYLNPKPAKLLIIGEGGGTIPTALQEMLPNTQIDLVELDKAVDSVARQYFEFKPGPKTRVFIEDGRVFVKRMIPQKPNYDLVLLDAFDADYIPEHMLTREFLQEVKSIMTPDGVIVANTFSDSALYDYESVTYRTVFGAYFNLKLANRIIVGAPADSVRRSGERKEERHVAGTSSASAAPAGFLPSLQHEGRLGSGHPVLTDQYSPSNLLNAIPRRPFQRWL